ncbi:Type 3 secretion system secretin [Paraburkholderia domus]|uniref:type II and III secretion system protein family protein n=1 Tax=Paraburkholderia domus TaxID=2793075 RepID=UPI0019131306|nr:type II and III secretion system protein family protein [Paraburkholderia domus]MBK5091591.1 type II and III secretion system protein family protein [Burkholderia sp. R-69927]MBK5181846.1 type II and III secretion system protein family protein [Burkholderia sp. R-69749]CAE6830290.1 Type 3 secretion system secretin [Paraburkholderia domus]CAE6938337.1 Type 3 secretion system secretin [Paraburkholderia domus]
MKTKLGFSTGDAMRRRSLSGVVLASALCTGLLVAQSIAAQEALEGPALAKVRPNAPLPVGRAPTPMMVSMAPMPAGGAAGASAPLRGPNCTGEIREETSVVVPVGKSTLLPLAEPARNRTLGNPTIVQATLVSPRTLYLVGMAVGTTNMIVQGRSGGCQIIDVIVNVDANGLQQSLGQLMPGERGIRVSTAAGNLVLGGHASSSPAAQQALEIAKAFASAQPTQQSQNGSGVLGNGTPVNQQSSSTSKAADVINMMTVDAPQQVMLEVKVAEVSKTLINQMGAALNIQGGFGSWSGALVSNLLAGVTSAIAGSKANNRPLSFAIDAQKTDDLVKILAEPNLVAISGQEASFLSGGKIFIPVPQSSSTGATTITLQEEEFGVGLKFTPTVLANGHINLKVAPEVSELSPTGITLSATNVSGVSILPLITTRRASTVVQMNDGESFAIGGLMSSNVTGALKAIPGIGEVPVLGALARSTSFQQDLTELVFIITPHLVKPLQTADLPLPTDSFSQPNEADVYATGNMEGRHPKMRAAPASTAPAASPMPAPASVSPQAPLPTPAPAPQPPAGPVATALPQPGPQAAAPSADRSRLIPDAAPGKAAPLTDAPPSAETDQAARAARIESAAARIASSKVRQEVANADASTHAVEH